MSAQLAKRLRFGSFNLALACLLAPGSAQAISYRTLFTPTGLSAGDQLGYSAASAGDVNGDGYADVIVGALGVSGNTGKAYIYFGGPGADAVADVILGGEGASNFFGFSVASAGDMNGDGYADVIVGAWNAVGKGRAYVYFGGPAMDATADLTMTGTGSSDQFGVSVAGAGDVNGDHYADVIVGANLNDNIGIDAGAAYLFFGGPSPDNVADVTFTGVFGGDQLGASVASAGDINGDGFSDLIIGVPFGQTNIGRAYIYYGGNPVDNTLDVVLAGNGDQQGAAVTSAGDVNGDGYADVIVGAPAAGSGNGSAALYLGGPSFADVKTLTFTGLAGEQLGATVASAGDVNGDGYADFMVGAPGHDGAGNDYGRVYVYFGGSILDSNPDLVLNGAAPGDFYGRGLAAAGDINGDGYGDLVIGAYQNDASGSNSGRAYVLSLYPYQLVSPNGGETWIGGSTVSVRWRGHDPADISVSLDAGSSWSTIVSGVGGQEDNLLPITAPTTPTNGAKIRVSRTGYTPTRSTSDMSDRVFRIIAPAPARPPAVASRLQFTGDGEAGTQLGSTLSATGDVNGDGYADLIVGAGQYSSFTGRAYVFYGGPTLVSRNAATANVVLTGEATTNYFGIAVASADLNGDGYADVIVGAPGYSTPTGRAYVFFGGPGLVSKNAAGADVILTGEPTSSFGTSVSGAGDFNRDGIADLIVGAQLYSSNTGRAYIFFGGPSLTSNNASTANVILTGEVSGAQFGSAVAGGGDVNGDGYADVLVGAGSYASLAGRTYLFEGTAAAASKNAASADAIFTGETSGSYFGTALSNSGDINGDGYADVVIGAYGYASQSGRVFVFPGGASIPSSHASGASVILNAEAASTAQGFGQSISTAGDVNGDGIADLLVGASQSGGLPGRAYVFYGGPSLVTEGAASAQIIVKGENANSGFGASVSCGDVNRDGYPDLVLGAPSYSSNAGRVYLYDAKRYFVTSPNGGETWPVGAARTVSWLGAEPADVWLSTDGGAEYERIETSVGGVASNSVILRVPHTPTKFARVEIKPAAQSVAGDDRSDSLFTIQTSVALLALLAAPAPQGAEGATVSWSTNPGPEDLMGYRLDVASGTGEWRAAVALTKETAFLDPTAGPATRYRLFAVNGFGEDLLLGETSLRPKAALSAWPLPYRGGSLSIAFATGSGLGGAAGSAEVAVYDVRGRLVRTVLSGVYPAGYYSAVWDGRDQNGHKVATGVYLLRSRSAGENRTIKLVIVR